MAKTKNVIDGLIFKDMMVSGYNNLKNFENTINIINVFPIPDKDTGTNMRLTIEHGITNAKANEDFGIYLTDLSSQMLIGARGNSGVILSQIFKGLAMCLGTKSLVTPHEFANGLIYGYRTAYKSVLNPTEGTILTASREAIETIKFTIRGKVNMAILFERYLSQILIVLKKTPDMLPCLKEAKVVDSGTLGYYKLIEGMYKQLINEPVKEEAISKKETENRTFIDEMRSNILKETAFKPIGVVCVSTGEGITSELNEQGVDYIIESDSSEAKVDEFIKAIQNVAALKIVIFPNSEMNIANANEAIDILKRNEVVVIESKLVVEAVYAIQMDVPDNDSNSRILEMRSNIKEIQSLKVSSSNDLLHDLKDILLKINNLEDKVAILLFFGKDCSKEEENRVIEYIENEYPFIELKTIRGQQKDCVLLGGVF